jgi:hypothetical protein
MPTISLEEQIAHLERELEALRRERESRKHQLTTLARRKQELQSQLKQVEAEIAALSSTQAAATEQPKKAVPSAPPLQSPSAGKPKLGELVLTLLGEAGKPMTARQLSEVVQQRGFRLSGNNPVKSVEARVQEMKKKGLVRRASGQPGYSLVSSAPGAKTEKAKSAPVAHPKRAKTAAKPATASKSAPPKQRGKQPSLRQAITDVLKNSRKPLSSSELAERVLASGYKSDSKNFMDAIWSMIGQMDNIERLEGKGYRLKKT